LEYIVIDGGSRDQSRPILERYSAWLTHWVSEPDDGQYDAINKGFALTSGDLMAWINADDLYEPGAFFAVAEIFAEHSKVEWLTSLRPLIRCEEPFRGRRRRLPGYCRRAFMRGEYAVGLLPWNSVWIPQEATFWRRSLWDKSGRG
jgi:glycosyltransferase involved in cell wall biosynthesis